MEYMSAFEASEKWGVSLRQVQRLLFDNRIPYTHKYGRAWMIPCNAEKPVDLRRKQKPLTNVLSADLPHVLAATTVPMPSHNPDMIMDTMAEGRLRIIYEAELSYLRGDFTRVMQCYNKTEGDVAARLRTAPLAIAAAISLGDYCAYTKIEGYLKECAEANRNSEISAIAELSLATAAVSVIAPNMAPSWLIAGDFYTLPHQIRPNALYLRAKY